MTTSVLILTLYISYNLDSLRINLQKLESIFWSRNDVQSMKIASHSVCNDDNYDADKIMRMVVVVMAVPLVVIGMIVMTIY